MNIEKAALLGCFFIASWSCAWFINYLAHQIWGIKEVRFKFLSVVLTAVALGFLIIPIVALVQELGFL